MPPPYRYSDYYYNQYQYGRDRYHAARMHRAPPDDYFIGNSYRSFEPQNNYSPEPLLRVSFRNYHHYPQEPYPMYNTYAHSAMSRNVDYVKDHRMVSHYRPKRAVKRAAPMENGPPNKKQNLQTTQRIVIAPDQINGATSSGQNKSTNTATQGPTSTTQNNALQTSKQSPTHANTKKVPNNPQPSPTASKKKPNSINQNMNTQKLVISEDLLKTATNKIVEIILLKKKRLTPHEIEFLCKIIKSRMRDLLQKTELNAKNPQFIMLYRNTFPIATDEATLKFAEDLQTECEKIKLCTLNGHKIEDKENIFDFFKANISFMLESVMVGEWPKLKSPPNANSFTPPFLETNKDNIELLLNEQVKRSDKYKELFDLVSEMAPQSPEIKSVFYTRILNDIVQNTVPKLIGGYKDLIMKCMRNDILSVLGQELLLYDPPPTNLSVIISFSPRCGFKKKYLIEFLKPFKVVKINKYKTDSYCVKVADLQHYNNLLKQDNVMKGKFKYSIKPMPATNSDLLFDKHYTQHFNSNINFKMAVTRFNCSKEATRNNASNNCMSKSTATINKNADNTITVGNPLNSRVQNLIEKARSESKSNESMNTIDMDLSLEIIEPHIDTIDLTDETIDQSKVATTGNVIAAVNNNSVTENAITEKETPDKNANNLIKTNPSTSQLIFRIDSVIKELRSILN